MSTIKKEHPKKQFLRRGLSLLLSLCMVASMFAGVLSFPALARELGPEAEQTEPEEATRGESRAEIKARLLRQIREEGWDPYRSNMTLDEFYALMELFQEGILPLDEEESMVEVIDPDTVNAD